MTNKLFQLGITTLSLLLTPTLGWALGMSISFQSASMQGDTRSITYNYGFNGKRVLHDNDGQASLVALLALMKQDYFEQKRSHEGPMGSVDFKNWKAYRSAVVGNLSRMEKYYTDQDFCNHQEAVVRRACSDIKQLKKTLTQGSVPFSAIFSLSGFLSSLESIGLRHTYQVDRYDQNGNKLPSSRENAPHFWSTDNLHVWLPDEESGARCKDYYSSESHFVAQLTGGPSSQPTARPASQRTRANN